MLELFALNAINSSNPSDPLTPAQKNVKAVASLLYLLLIVWAIVRVMHCSSATPDSRALHFMFAFTSPTLYILLSYAVPGFSEK